MCACAISLATHSAHAFYNPSTGRWFSRDPAGENDGANLCGFVGNNTVNKIDVWGLWGTDVHYFRTEQWARELGISPGTANAIGGADEAIDTLYTTMVFSDANWAWHFNRSSGAKDSRLILSEWQVLMAKMRCDCERGTDDSFNASVYLGHALHPLQDWVAHADFNRKLEAPRISGFHWWEKIQYWHNYLAGGASKAKQTDDPTFDGGGPDGRATLATMKGSKTLSNGDQLYWTDFNPGRHRIGLTETLTKSRLADFQAHVRLKGKPGGECWRAFLGSN